MSLFHYIVHDIFIESDIPLNFAFNVGNKKCEECLYTIKINYSSEFSEPTICEQNKSISILNNFDVYETSDGCLVCRFHGDIFVRISKCKKIFDVYCPFKKIVLVSDYFIESFIPVCLLNNNHYILHASCLALNDKALLLCADSGVGKSTLAYKLYLKGWSVLSDDLICLLKEGDQYYARGVFNMPIKLYKDVIKMFNLPLAMDSYSDCIQNKIVLNNVPVITQKKILGTVCILVPTNDNNSKIDITHHTPDDTLRQLLYHTTGLWALDRRQKAKIILNYSEMVRNCSFNLISLKYPKNIDILENLCCALSDMISVE